MTEFKVRPEYGSIEAARDIAEPWFQMEGSEWGDSMANLHGAAHTSYGFSDEDCALFASKLLENLVEILEWAFEYYEREEIERAQKEAREARDYWLAGGNLGDFGTTKDDAKFVIDQLPGWIFGEAETT